MRDTTSLPDLLTHNNRIMRHSKQCMQQLHQTHEHIPHYETNIQFERDTNTEHYNHINHKQTHML